MSRNKRYNHLPAFDHDHGTLWHPGESGGEQVSRYHRVVNLGRCTAAGGAGGIGAESGEAKGVWVESGGARGLGEESRRSRKVGAGP